MTPPGKPRDWVSEEAGLDAVWAELSRLRRRAVARPLRTLGLALLFALLAVLQRAQKTRTYRSTVVLRVTEGDLDAATAPRPNRRLREYVSDVVFSNERLGQVLRDFGLYARERKRSETFALESMRDDLAVAVWRNYFLESREEGDAGRSARVAVSYQHKDPQMALKVARRLGRLVVEREEAARRAEAEEAERQATHAVAVAKEELVRRRAAILTAELALGRAPPREQPLRRVQLADLTQSVEPMELRVRELEKKRAAFALRGALEVKGLGLRFDVVDAGAAARLGLARPRELALVGVLVFLLVLPLAGLLVGAFDSRVWDAEDVGRLGVVALGKLPLFPGDNVAALDARLADAAPAGDGAPRDVPIE